MEFSQRTNDAHNRVLVVADWTTDPEAVVSAVVERHSPPESEFALLVPAWLHGLDWVGDPFASVPCAQRQLAAIGRVAQSIGLAFHAASVGDPDPAAAICDALDDWPATEVVLCRRTRRASVAHPFDMPHRVRRAAGLPVSVVRLAASEARRTRGAWLPRRTGHCALEQPHPA
jgi:hypothetical protein